MRKIKDEAEKPRSQHKGKKGHGPLYPIAEARRRGRKPDWKKSRPPVPAVGGIQLFHDYPLAEIAKLIDWTPFFQTWELTGRYPAILRDGIVGEAARNLFDDAQAMLARIIEEKWLGTTAVIGLFPANSAGDDVEVYTDESRRKCATTFHFLRQQSVKT